MNYQSQNQSDNSIPSKKLCWVAPKFIVIDVNIIAQEQEELEKLIMNIDEQGFKMLTGTVPSDYRLKKDLTNFCATEIVTELKAYEFAWKHNNEREIGFMAHEIQSVLPYLVVGEKDAVDAEGKPVVQRVNYAKLTPILLKAIQEQQALIESMQKQIEELAAAIGDTSEKA